MRVLILDDQPIARRGLATLCRETFDVEEVLEVERPIDALTAARRAQPQLIVLELRLPGSPRVDLLCAQLLASAPSARVAIVTASEDADALGRCLAAGASACLLKDAPLLEIAAGLEAIMAGRTAVDPRIAERLAAERARKLRGEPPSIQLTRRERDVLALLAEGCSNRLIAERLKIGEATVKSYVAGLMRKLDASSRLQAVVRASERGVL